MHSSSLSKQAERNQSSVNTSFLHAGGTAQTPSVCHLQAQKYHTVNKSLRMTRLRGQVRERKWAKMRSEQKRPTFKTQAGARLPDTVYAALQSEGMRVWCDVGEGSLHCPISFYLFMFDPSAKNPSDTGAFEIQNCADCIATPSSNLWWLSLCWT